MKYYFLALGTLVVVCVGCSVGGQKAFDRGAHHAPPAAMMQRPGPMVDGPGPGVLPLLAPPPLMPFGAEEVATTQVGFIGPAGMQIGWKVPHGYAENQLTAPGRYNFPQAATYRLKLTNVPGPGREGLVLYPTLQVYPTHPTTAAYLAHNSVPVELTDEDIDQVESNNFVTKVIYLPDPRFQEWAIAGVETLVSTRLDPGLDPVAEADRRGTIMAVLRLGNMHLEMSDPAGLDGEQAPPPDAIHAASHRRFNGDDGDFLPPMPIDKMGHGQPGIPGAMMVGGAGAPGGPAYNPIAGVGTVPVWGQPMTGTPIGLPGPPHLPLGGPAGLKSHTMRNRTKHDLPAPVDHMLIDVKHKPGLSVPKPAKHIEYKETHPSYGPGEVSYPGGAGHYPGQGMPFPHK